MHCVVFHKTLTTLEAVYFGLKCTFGLNLLYFGLKSSWYHPVVESVFVWCCNEII